MRNPLLLLCSLLLASACAPEARPACAPAGGAAAEPRPIAVLLQHSPWTGGTERPLFVLYESGRVLYPGERHPESGIPASYRTACLRGEPDALLARFGIGAELRRLRPRYDYRPGWTDQESVFLLTWRGDSLTRITVRAGLTGVDRFSPEVPGAFREAYRRMTELEARDAGPWTPDSLEVMAWPYEYAPDDPPLPWPSGWPDLESPGARHDSDPVVKEMHRFSLAGDRAEELDTLLARRRARQAIGMNGRKWAVGYRIRIPGEERWRPLLRNRLEG